MSWGPDPAPADVWLATNFFTVFERRASVGCPGHLPYAWVPLDAFDAKAGPERAAAQVGFEPFQSPREGKLLLRRQASPVAP